MKQQREEETKQRTVPHIHSRSDDTGPGALTIPSSTYIATCYGSNSMIRAPSVAVYHWCMETGELAMRLYLQIQLNAYTTRVSLACEH